jgi:catechol 2,3-dioxygenase-like lactoylglutathione lyase family enzyme
MRTLLADVGEDKQRAGLWLYATIQAQARQAAICSWQMVKPTGGSMIQRVDNIGIAVRDLRRAITFYTDTLGLALQEQGETDAWIGIGPVSLYLFETQCQTQPPQRGADLTATPTGIDHSAVGVADIEQACRELAANGVSFAGEIIGAPGEFRYRGFGDPDGNMLYVVQRP